MKMWICSVFGAVGGVVSYLVGGWNTAIITLLIFMLIDYITGLVVAGIFHNSKKTPTGGLDSKIGFVGILKKCMIFCLIIVAHLLDLLLNIDLVRNGVIIAFISNELLSIIENAGLMGVPIPEIIKKALNILQEKSESEEL